MTHPMTSRRLSLLGLVTAVTVLVVGCTANGGNAPDGKAPDGGSQTQQATGGAVFSRSEVDPLVAQVVHKTVKPLPTERLADGLLPPTNRWFSGLVFGDKPQPVFPLPLSFGLTDTGFAFGQPTVSATEKNIAGGFKGDVTVDTGATAAQVSGYDTATVTVAGLDTDGEVLGHTTIAQGSPYVSYTAAQRGELSTGGLQLTQTGDHWTAKVGETSYGLVVSDGSVSDSTVELDKGGVATWFAVPTDGSADKLAELAADPVTGSAVSYRVDDEQFATTLTYRSTGNTAVGALPHQQKNLAKGASCDLGSYPTIYGTLQLCEANELSWTSPVSQPTSALDLGKLSGGDEKKLSAQVTEDIAALPAFPADTYFGGKALYRAAMLLQLAEQLEVGEAATTLRTTLTEELTKWTDPKGCDDREAFCFVYDDQAKGVVGLTPSFGSEEFNDHHFHYGYFLYAAGVLAEKDPALAAKFAPVMDLLAADIGSSAGNGAFPDRRVFDVYAGHSWASGTSPFADGNNQESSSEAITAWTGLALWGRASDNAALVTDATWMLSLEAQSGLAYWTNFDRAEPVYSGYGHQIVSLNWGGKRDYATWFSPEPAAMLGILVIPMSPASTYLAGDAARIDANVAEATGGRFDQKFGDYLLMYSALAGEKQREAALATAEKLDGKWIDDGNSRSYMLAWLMTATAA